MDKFQRRALQTWYDENHELHYDMRPAAMGLVGETGEVIELVKKHYYKPGWCLDVDDLIDELGDVYYYLVILAYQCRVTLEELADLNYKKLTERESNGTGYNRGIENGQ